MARVLAFVSLLLFTSRPAAADSFAALCQIARLEALANQPGDFVPQCLESGWGPFQFWGSTGQTFCVYANGQEILGTRRSPLQPPVDCISDLTPCQAAAAEAIRLTDDNFLPGLFIPRCNEFGAYAPSQSLPSSGYTWCVTEDGQEIPGTQRGPGQDPVNCLGETCECNDVYRSAECLREENDHVGWEAVNIPNCNFDQLLDILAEKYDCARASCGGDTLYCNKNVPESEHHLFTQCQEYIKPIIDINAVHP